MSSFKKLIESAKNQPVEEQEQEATANNQHIEQETTPENKPTKNDSKAPTNKELSLKKKPEVGKSKDPNYRQTTIYVHKTLHRKVVRMLEDQDYEGDFSDWIEECMLSVLKR